MSLLRFPDPFDFELSTGRFRAFGTDLANRLVGSTLYRAVGGREVRIVARPGGVDVEPLDAVTEPVIAQLLGAPFELDPFYAWAAADPVLAPITDRLRGFRPPLSPDPFESLVTSITAQQVSLFSAAAMRSRMVERFGERIGESWAFPTRERMAAADEDELFACGFSRRKAEYVIGLAGASSSSPVWRSLPTTRSAPASRPCGDSAPGRRSGSSPATLHAHAPGRPATWCSARRPTFSTVSR
jgi:3-methyladenine DNA glycosylase/8-oxoguanine DNA glycosylase